MKKLSIAIITLIIAALPTTPNFSNKKGVNWLTFEQASALAKTKPKKMLIDVYTDWCGWCKKMDATTFANPKIAAYVNQYFYAVKFNSFMLLDDMFFMSSCCSNLQIKTNFYTRFFKLFYVSFTY